MAQPQPTSVGSRSPCSGRLLSADHLVGRGCGRVGSLCGLSAVSCSAMVALVVSRRRMENRRDQPLVLTTVRALVLAVVCFLAPVAECCCGWEGELSVGETAKVCAVDLRSLSRCSLDCSCTGFGRLSRQPMGLWKRRGSMFHGFIDVR